MIEDYLLQVRRPGRYIGQEWNTVKKDPAQADVKFALCFPDLYEVGMSNLGVRIIYGLLNNSPGISCERFFSPSPDMENILRINNLEITSLESKAPLKGFDFTGFSLGYELSFTNVLNLLDLAGIPLKSTERGRDFPLVIGGGPCVLNPEPMHEFFDLFVIGEAEDVIIEIAAFYREIRDKYKTGRITKEELLIQLCRIEGVYVPSLYDVRYSPEGNIEAFSPKFAGVPHKIKKRHVQDLSSAPYPLKWLLPYIEIIHDRITLELARGCPNNCYFCQARRFYAPFRQRSADEVLNLAGLLYQNTGYEEISLAGLSISDYPCLDELLRGLVNSFKKKGVNISLPSIKPKTLVGNFATLIATVKKTGLTFAPEAATEKLRRVLNKDFDLESFFQAINQAYTSGYRRVKLYFMIGLPGETSQDLDGILDFAKTVSELKRKVDNQAAEINISINALIPKPHTPFQWLGMEATTSIESKINYLRDKPKNKRIRLHFHHPQMSFLEAVFSRGDRRLSSVIEAAFRKGARFDAWDEHFVFEKWRAAFRETGINPHFLFAGEISRSNPALGFFGYGYSQRCFNRRIR